MKSKKQQKHQQQHGNQVQAHQNVGSELDRETTAFERFENEVKYTIFNVLYVLLKDDESSSWKEMMLSTLDFLEIYYFSFFSFANFPWKSGSAQVLVVNVLEFIQIETWYAKLDLTTYLVFFYIVTFMIVLVILDILYVSYSFQKKKFRFIWPLQALRSVVSLFVTALFLPVLETFVSVIDCHTVNGENRHVLFPEVICFEGMHIIHATISIVLSFLFMIICLIVALTYFEASSQSKDYSARVNARADVYLVVLKIIGTYIFLVIGKPQYHWLLIFILLVLSYQSFANFRYHWPYYKDRMNKFFCITTGIFLWINFCLLIAKILEDTDFTGALQLMFMGVPLIIGVIVFGKDERSKLLMKNINNFQTGEELSLQIRYFLQLIETKNQNRKNAIILKGYIHQHEENCSTIECNLKAYKNSQYQQNKTGNLAQDRRIQMINIHNRDQYLYLHAQCMFKEGLKRFPSCTALQIQYAFFLTETLSKKKEGLMEFSKAMQFNPSFDEEFIIYRQLKMSEDFGDGDDHHDAGGQSLDIVGKLAYESSLRQFQQNIERSGKIHYEFWNLLGEDRPDMRKLNYQGSRINSSIAAVESYWNQLQKLNADQPEALKLYSKFLIDILNDKEGGQELLMRAKNAMQNKKNHFDSGNETEHEINSQSMNGCACIYALGNNENLGLINQCNTAAVKMFGFSMSEITNHHVEKFMPDIYTKYHKKIMQDAMQRGSENISKKERMVFGRHKSGFVFPVWLQIKLIESMSNGLQFVAIFQVDKKLMNSDVGYILLNKEKKIVTLSAACMKIFDYDQSKLRKFATSGQEITKFAPELFSSKSNDQALSSKHGLNLNFFVPEMDKNNRTGGGTSRTNKYSENITEDNSIHTQHSKLKYKNQVSFSQSSMKRLTLSCQLQQINMCEYDEIGWYLKISHPQDVIQQDKITKGRDKIKQGKLKQPLFQFRYDLITGKFVRELKDSIAQDCMKNPQFSKGYYQSMVYDYQIILDKKIHNENKAIQIKNLPGDNEVVDPADILLNDKLKLPIDRHSLDILEQKKIWGTKIHTYRLQNGKFVHKDSEEEQKRMLEFEREKNKQLKQEEVSSQNITVFKNNLKSRKNLQNALNEQKTPLALRNLQIVMNLIIIGIFTLGIAEFVSNNIQYDQINENFHTIEQSYTRIAEFQRIAYDVRSIIYINEKKQNLTKQFTTKPDFIQYLLLDIESALDNIYTLQAQIMLAPTSGQAEQVALLDTQSVNLAFLTQDDQLKVLSFSLNEAVQQMASAAFSLRHLDAVKIQNKQEDSFFLTYNCFNDFLIALRKSSHYYVIDQNDRVNHKFVLVLLLFLISLGILLISVVILVPVIRNVNQTRTLILTLLIDIPNSNIMQLSNQCENFLNHLENDGEDGNEEIASEPENGKVEQREESQWTVVTNQRGINKLPKNLKLSYKQFAIQVALASSFIAAYYSIMFYLNYDYVNDIKRSTVMMGILGQAETYFILSQNSIREMLYDSEKPILNTNSFNVVSDSIEQLYRLNYEIMENQFSNQEINDQMFNDMFDTIYHTNLCTNSYGIFDFTLIPIACEALYSQSVQNGLQGVIIRYIETLKKVIKDVVLYREKGFNAQNLINSDQFVELFTLHFRIIKDSFRKLMNTLSDSIQNNYTTKLNLRIIAFIIFIAFIILGYMLVWIPYVKNLKKEIWRTKQMLTIIPIEVIKKLPKIQEYIFNESVVTKQQQQIKSLSKDSKLQSHKGSGDDPD